MASDMSEKRPGQPVVARRPSPGRARPTRRSSAMASSRPGGPIPSAGRGGAVFRDRSVCGRCVRLRASRSGRGRAPEQRKGGAPELHDLRRAEAVQAQIANYETSIAAQQKAVDELKTRLDRETEERRQLQGQLRVRFEADASSNCREGGADRRPEQGDRRAEEPDRPGSRGAAAIAFAAPRPVRRRAGPNLG